MREACVAPTDEEAIEAARPFLEEKYRVYAGWGQDDSLGGGWDALAAERFIVGSPQTVLSELESLRDRLGATDVSLRLAWPGCPHEVTMRSIDLLSSEVLPHLREDAASRR